MNLIRYFSPAPQIADLPLQFNSPFSDTPHPLAVRAAVELQQLLSSQTDWQHDFHAPDGGKMLGVLVVKTSENRLGFISAFSGMLAGQWVLPGFVPPLFDQGTRDSFLREGEAQLDRYTHDIVALQSNELRSSMLAQLTKLTTQREQELSSQTKQHKTRKALRNQQRINLKHNASLRNSAEQTGKELERLSFESQQDKRERRGLQAQWDVRLQSIQNKVDEIARQIEALKQTRTDTSRDLHTQVFSTYILSNRRGEKKPITELFSDDIPPAGAGDCAAPKLLHYAYQHGLIPLALAEFWWGASPRDGVRHHMHFYPACRSKCQTILPFMLQGLDVKQLPVAMALGSGPDSISVVYEDADILVINKPSGMLTVPGKLVRDSVLTRVQKSYPDATGPLVAHRLDQATSGLLLVAKNAATHKALQQQFQQRSIEKRYVAVLSKRLSVNNVRGVNVNTGTIDLPLRVDLDDRPRQLVCNSHGKAAITHWRVISYGPETTRVYFYPITGRTHQLRVHAAHKDGLDAPIVGDVLYGKRAERLSLHAERLRFRHPSSGKPVEVIVPPPF